MNSFTRQPTLDSVRSWWSDSNPTGPNINLHALTKPLMKLMYHRQAVDYIAGHRRKPLLRGDVDIYASYLGFKYVSSTTKIAILRELAVRCESWEDNAATVADILSSYPVDFLLESPNAKVQGLTCRLLECLARQCPNRTASWVASVCKQLASLLRDENSIAREEPLRALVWIARSTGCAQVVVDAYVLDGVPELVESPNTTVRQQTCELLKALASHKAMESSNSCELLVTLLRDENFLVIESAIWALYLITESPEGMQTALDANLLDHVAELLESRRLYTWRWMCRMLAAHDGMLATLVGGTHCKRLVSLLGKQWEDRSIVEVLRWISKSPEGAQAAVDADILASVEYLLDTSPRVQQETCKMLGALASHGSTVAAVLHAMPCVQLVSLLRDADSLVRDDALCALAQISEHPEGVAAIADADILAHVATLMEGQDRAVQFQTCIILRNLCRHQGGLQAES
ncbi:armadillo-type protein [Mycena vulgaris]|nr:armadillo-type protein [Mycena vulgaris]